MTLSSIWILYLTHFLLLPSPPPWLPPILWLLSSTAPVQSCSPFKSILTPNTSLFSQPACPKYFPPALTERVFTGQLQNNKFPFFETVVWGALWCGSWPTGDHLAGVAHYWVVNLTCRTEWLGSLWSPVRHFWVPSIKLCLMCNAKISALACKLWLQGCSSSQQWLICSDTINFLQQLLGPLPALQRDVSCIRLSTTSASLSWEK